MPVSLPTALRCPLLADLLEAGRAWRDALDAAPYHPDRAARALEAFYLALEAVDDAQGIKKRTGKSRLARRPVLEVPDG